MGFSLEAKTAAALVPSRKLLAEVPQSRLFDEMLKLLQTGHGLATIEQLKKLGLAQGIYPLLDVVVERANTPFVACALQDTDRRVAEGKSVAPSFLLATVLWQDVRDGWSARLAKKENTFPALQEAIDEVFNQRIGDVSGRGKLAADMREIWVMQPRFDKRVGSGPHGLVEQARFRAGFDFMRLRAEVGEIEIELADWWEDFSLGSDEEREALLAQVRPAPRRVSKAAPRPEARTAAAKTGAESTESLEGHLAEGAQDPVAPKKRRRRRKPAGARGDGALGSQKGVSNASSEGSSGSGD